MGFRPETIGQYLKLAVDYMNLGAKTFTKYRFLLLKVDLVHAMNPMYKLKVPETGLKPPLCQSQPDLSVALKQTDKLFLKTASTKRPLCQQNGHCTPLGL